MEELSFKGNFGDTTRVVVGTLFLTGIGIPQNFSAAHEWLGPAAANGHPHGQYLLGSLYFLGLLGNTDYAAAASWLKRSAEQGHSGAQFRLGHLYENGLGVPLNFLAAVNYYEMAAQQGHPTAFLTLGVLLARNGTVQSDQIKAYACFSLALTLGSDEAKRDRSQTAQNIPIFAKHNLEELRRQHPAQFSDIGDELAKQWRNAIKR